MDCSASARKAAALAWMAAISASYRTRSASSSYVHDGVPVWQMLVHVVNHGTYHRGQITTMLTAEGRSPGELDLINYAEEQATGGSANA